MQPKAKPVFKHVMKPVIKREEGWPCRSARGLGGCWRRKQSSNGRGFFPWDWGSRAPGKSDPVSAMVRLVSPSAPGLWRLGQPRSGTGLLDPAPGRPSLKPPPPMDWLSPHPITILPHQITTLLENWVVWVLFSPLGFHFYSTVSHQCGVLWRHTLHVLMF